MENKESKDWNLPGAWAQELIEQAKSNAKRWFIAWIVTLIALFATNIYWISAFNSYDYISQDGDGINNVNTGEQGDLTNGTEITIEKGQVEEQGNETKEEKEVKEE